MSRKEASSDYAEKNRQRVLKHYQKNKEKVKQRIAKRRKVVRSTAIEILGGKCSICGFSDYRALQIDHINGNGSKERKEKGSGYSIIIQRYIVHNPVEAKKKYQVLCANCNWIKRYENREVPFYVLENNTLLKFD